MALLVIEYILTNEWREGGKNVNSFTALCNEKEKTTILFFEDKIGFYEMKKKLRKKIKEKKEITKKQDTVVLWSNVSCIKLRGQRFKSHHRHGLALKFNFHGL